MGEKGRADLTNPQVPNTKFFVNNAFFVSNQDGNMLK